MADGSDLVEVLSDNDADSAPQRPGGWSCAQCTFVNQPRFLACDVCGSQRPNPGAQAGVSTAPGGAAAEPLMVDPSEPSQQQQQEKGAARYGWACQACTYKNASSQAQCEMCSAAGPSAAAAGQQHKPGEAAAVGAAAAADTGAGLSKTPAAAGVAGSEALRVGAAPVLRGSYALDCGCRMPAGKVQLHVQEAAAALPRGLPTLVGHFCCPNQRCRQLVTHRDLEALLGGQEAGKVEAHIWAAAAAAASAATSVVAGMSLLPLAAPGTNLIPGSAAPAVIEIDASSGEEAEVLELDCSPRGGCRGSTGAPQAATVGAAAAAAAGARAAAAGEAPPAGGAASAAAAAAAGARSQAQAAGSGQQVVVRRCAELAGLLLELHGVLVEAELPPGLAPAQAAGKAAGLPQGRQQQGRQQGRRRSGRHAGGSGGSAQQQKLSLLPPEQPGPGETQQKQAQQQLQQQQQQVASQHPQQQQQQQVVGQQQGAGQQQQQQEQDAPARKSRRRGRATQPDSVPQHAQQQAQQQQGEPAQKKAKHAPQKAMVLPAWQLPPPWSQAGPAHAMGSGYQHWLDSHAGYYGGQPGGIEGWGDDEDGEEEEDGDGWDGEEQEESGAAFFGAVVGGWLGVGRGRGRGGRGGGWGGGWGGRGRGKQAGKQSKGVGYGGGHGGPESGKQARQRQQDAAQRQEQMDGAATELLARLRQRLQAWAGEAQARLAPLPLPLLAALRGGPLAPLLRLLLQNDSLMDVSGRRALYVELFGLVGVLAGSADLLPLLLQPAESELLKKTGGAQQAQQQAGQAQQQEQLQAGQQDRQAAEQQEEQEVGSPGAVTTAGATGGRRPQRGRGSRQRGREVSGQAAPEAAGESKAAEAPKEGSGAAVQEAQAPAGDTSCWHALQALRLQADIFRRNAEQLAAEGDEEDVRLVGALLDVLDCCQRVQEAVDLWRASTQQTELQPLSGAQPAGGGHGNGADPQHAQQAQQQAAADSPELRQQYVTALKPLLFQSVPLMGDHYFRQQAANSQGRLSTWLRRVTKEVASLAGQLPLTWESSVLAAMDDDTMAALRAVMFAPADTPYAHGCFAFDILLPPDYPNKPPQVQFLTTGGGRVRFNPNLYDNGKVCLSLLGTWSGPSWEPGQSTLLQVLVSIQSMILGTAEPFYNEPGYSSMEGSAEGNQQSRKYNAQIRRHTLEVAILGQLEKPPVGFEEAIRLHYRMKAGVVKEQARQWAREDASLKQLVVRVERALDALVAAGH